MTTKEYLYQIIGYQKRIENRLTEIYRLRSMACGITMSLDDDRVQTTPNPDRMGDMVAKIVELEEEAHKLIDDFAEKQKHIVKQIEEMEDDDDYGVLFYKYVDGMSLNDIPEVLSMSRRKTFYVYNRALSRFEEKYGKEYKDCGTPSKA